MLYRVYIRRLHMDSQSALGWQAHSMNDLRLWPQLARKSSRNMLSIKVDLHSLTERGFHLTHDSPQSNIVYNTSKDMLDVCEQVLKSWPALFLRVALCFKASHNFDPCSNSRESQDWLMGADEFYTEAEELRAKFPGRLEFILDGVAQPISCLSDRWRPWNSVWIPTDHSPVAALFSNYASMAYDRFAVLNPKDAKIQWLALRLVQYGKFLHGPYPFQVWEPDSQDTIDSYASEFATFPPAGFDFSINIDPNMWSVFTAEHTQQAWNFELPIPDNNVSTPFLVPLDDHHFLVVYWAEHAKTFKWITFRAQMFSSDITPLKTGDFRQGTTPVAFVSEQINRSSFRITSVGMFTIEEFVACIDGSLYYIESAPLPSAFGIPLAARPRKSKELALLLHSISPGILLVHSTQGNASEILWSLPKFDGLIVTADFVEVNGTFMAVAGNGTHIFVTSRGSMKWSLLGVGVHVSLSMLSRTSQDAVIALISDGGYCYNSRSHNTRGAPMVCDQKPAPCKEALDYTIGTMSQWIKLANDSELATPCGELLHGTYDLGSSPRSALLGLNDEKVALLAVHVGLSESIESCGCGKPTWRPGKLVLDGFALNFNAIDPGAAHQ